MIELHSSLFVEVISVVSILFLVMTGFLFFVPFNEKVYKLTKPCIFISILLLGIAVGANAQYTFKNKQDYSKELKSKTGYFIKDDDWKYIISGDKTGSIVATIDNQPALLLWNKENNIVYFYDINGNPLY